MLSGKIILNFSSKGSTPPGPLLKTIKKINNNNSDYLKKGKKTFVNRKF